MADALYMFNNLLQEGSTLPLLCHCCSKDSKQSYFQNNFLRITIIIISLLSYVSALFMDTIFMAKGFEHVVCSHKNLCLTLDLEIYRIIFGLFLTSGYLICFVLFGYGLWLWLNRKSQTNNISVTVISYILLNFSSILQDFPLIVIKLLFLSDVIFYTRDVLPVLLFSATLTLTQSIIKLVSFFFYFGLRLILCCDLESSLNNEEKENRKGGFRNKLLMFGSYLLGFLGVA